jgi:hypothetical protein
MGDIGDLSVVKRSDYTRFTYTAIGRSPHEWEYKYVGGVLNPDPAQFAGVMYLSPPNNWGDVAGSDLRAFGHSISWEARSLRGPVSIEFVIGGVAWKWDYRSKTRVSVTCPDTLRRRGLGVYSLGTRWRHFSVDISDIPTDQFYNVEGAFAWIISWPNNGVTLNRRRTHAVVPKTFVVDVRNIRYQGG